MIQYVVNYAEEFDERLEIIADYMEFHGCSEASIARYITEVYDACEAFATYPNRGTPQDDVMPGLKTTHYKGDTILAFVVEEDAEAVWFLGVFYGGQDWQSAFSDRSSNH
ncbi:toxin ParE1/3/4 [Paraburkholderia sp. WC7.3g]|uniref:type II toxin-antitoxin system RelE/ParE family toxin n=1 Tax=Paraburkholderia sp. WC7.3g TaxID=2991070 RepID=UPI003D1DA7FD